MSKIGCIYAAFIALVMTVFLIGAPAVAENEPAELESYEIKLIADPQDGGILSGEGVYEEGTEVNLTATGLGPSGWLNRIKSEQI